MTHKLLILMTALVLAGCAGKTRNANTENEEATTQNVITVDSLKTETVPVQKTFELVPFTAEELAKGIIDDEGIITAKPELLSRVNVARYKEFGLTEIETLDPFVVGAYETVVLKDPENADYGLNALRFYEWGEEQWLNNNYIRSVRLYLDAYYLGLVKNEAFDKYKESMKGKFIIAQIEPFEFGGAWFTIVFVDDPRFMLRFWVYSFVSATDPVVISGYDVRGADLIDEPFGPTTEEINQGVSEMPHMKLW